MGLRGKKAQARCARLCPKAAHPTRLPSLRLARRDVCAERGPKSARRARVPKPPSPTKHCPAWSMRASGARTGQAWCVLVADANPAPGVGALHVHQYRAARVLVQDHQGHRMAASLEVQVRVVAVDGVGVGPGRETLPQNGGLSTMGDPTFRR